jgi:hypothetical protein
MKEKDMRGGILVRVVVLGLVLLGCLPGFLAPAQAQTAPALPEADMRELVEAAKATAKAARENVDYARVTPDILTQILAKLDKIENKLDKVESAIKDGNRRRPR